MLNNQSAFWQEHEQPFGKEGDSDSDYHIRNQES